MKRSHALVLVLCVGFINAVDSWTARRQLDFQFVIESSKTAGALVALFAIFEYWLWRVPLLFPWFVAVPNISGKWELNVQATIPGAEEPSAEEVTGTIEVRQSFSSIEFLIHWANGTTTQTQGAVPLAASENGNCVFSATYSAERAPNLAKVPTRHAAFFFSTRKQRPDALTVHYSTTDGQVGTARFSHRESSSFWQRLRPI